MRRLDYLLDRLAQYYQRIRPLSSCSRTLFLRHDPSCIDIRICMSQQMHIPTEAPLDTSFSRIFLMVNHRHGKYVPGVLAQSGASLLFFRGTVLFS